MGRVECSCGGKNKRCSRCGGRGWYDDGWQSSAPFTLWSHDDGPMELPGGSPSFSYYPSDGATGFLRTYRIILDNPSPPLRLPLERQPKRRKRTVLPNGEMAGVPKTKVKAKRPKTSATQVDAPTKIERNDEASFVVEFSNRKLRCTYPIEGFNNFQAEDFVARLLPIVRGIDDGGFWKSYDLKVLHLRCSGRATLIAEKDGIAERIILSPIGVSSRELLSPRSTATQPPSQATNPPRAKTSTHLGSEDSGKSRYKAKSRRTERDQFEQPDTAMTLALKNALSGSVEDPIQRNQDATKDYWQLRDHGQFGSHPSHDDYDE